MKNYYQGFGIVLCFWRYAATGPCFLSGDMRGGEARRTVPVTGNSVLIWCNLFVSAKTNFSKPSLENNPTKHLHNYCYHHVVYIVIFAFMKCEKPNAQYIQHTQDVQRHLPQTVLGCLHLAGLVTGVIQQRTCEHGQHPPQLIPGYDRKPQRTDPEGG